MNPGPLSRIRVLDLTRVRAGPTAVRQLADWGADVVKIEPPEAADRSAGLGGPRDGPDFQNLHRNKRSMTIDLKRAAGRDLFLRLVEQADVVVENFRPAVKHALGIDYDACRERQPAIVYASISGFGQTGPYAERPGFDQIAQGMGGLMSITGLRGQGPVRAGIPIADLAAGLYGAIGILVALVERQSTGEGRWIHTSLLEAQIAMLDFQAARWTIGGAVPEQAGNNHPTSIPTGVFATADGHINVAATGDVIWGRLCRVLDAETLRDDEDFATAKARYVNRDRLNRRLGERFVARTSAEWIARLNEAGVPCGPINRIDQVFSDPQVAHLGMTRPVEHPRRGTIDVVRQAVTLEGADDGGGYRVAPERGQHTDEILDELGYTKADIRKLRHGGVV